ncbi:MAG: GNAT family N-acetyltransferase [Mesorhizobium sp.]|nr:GNAT family N-acetyltransferase [Mesorhizobium sp.]MBL8577176.1 GNAT family N-acetyltransferase [Mesorhizobium sp.]
MDRQFVIRAASPSDAASLSDFASQQFRATYSADTPAPDLEAYISENFTAEKQSEEITHSGSDVLIAAIGEKIVGFAHVEFQAGLTPSAFLNRIYVEQSWKGKAVGSALLAEVVGKARGLGAERIKLTVYEKNARAVAFYKKAGFSVIGTEVFPVGEDRQTDLVMERLLVQLPR